MTRRARFPFRRQLTHLGFTHVPIVKVELDHRGSRILADMIVDSGAEITMIPLRVGNVLGLRRARREPTRELGGISGKVPYLLKTVAVVIGPIRLDVRLAWAQEEDVPLLLGRLDVFDRLRICFDRRRDRVDLVS